MAEESRGYTNIVFIIYSMPVIHATSWPSGLRRNVKAVVFIGAGSNPADVIFFPSHSVAINV